MPSVAEVDVLAAAIPETWRIAVELAAWCHRCLGEVLGLERGDVDLLHRRIHPSLFSRRPISGAWSNTWRA